MFSIFAFVSATDVHAGASACGDDFCRLGSEVNCTNLGGCAVGGGGSDTPCSWCGTFCADECPAPAPGPTVIVPTMTQWGIIFASIFLGVIGIVAIIR